MLVLRLILLLKLFVLFCRIKAQSHGVKDATVYGKMQFRAITEPDVYNKQTPPPEYPLKVMSNLVLYSFGSIEETEASYSIQLLIRLGWTDTRLIFAPQRNDSTVFRIDGGSWHVNRIWTPSVHLPNNKQPKALQNSGNEPILAHIYSNGTILISKRVLLTGFCNMDFKLYPLDIQFCDIQIESFALSTDQLILEWIENEPLDINSEFSWSGFTLTNITLSNATTRYQTLKFSKLMATFMLKREFGHFIFVVYLPSMMFVITSWVSFWLEIPAAPARVTLGLTSLLTLVTNSKVAREELPQISYVHALDIWILMCTVYVFASLIEYAIVNFIYNTEKRAKKLKNDGNVNNTSKHSNKENGVTNKSLSISRQGSFVSLENYDITYNAQQSHAHPSKPSTVSGNGVKDSRIAIKVSSDMVSIATNLSKLDSASVAPAVRASVKTDPQDFAYGIDRKCRIIFPLSFLFLNVIYWTTLALLAQYS